MKKGKRRDTEMVRLGRSAKKLLKVGAAKRNRTMSALLEDAIRAYLSKPSSSAA